MGLSRAFDKVGLDVLTGRAPLTAKQFRALDTDKHTNHQTDVERCIGILNGKLLGGSFSVDCTYSTVVIAVFEPEVVDEALRIMREVGGWREARVLSYDSQSTRCWIQFHH